MHTRHTAFLGVGLLLGLAAASPIPGETGVIGRPSDSQRETAPPSSTPRPRLPLAGAEGVVFVSRPIPDNGSRFWPETGAMPGAAGHWGRFLITPGSRLLARTADGVVQVLIDGTNPTPETLNLVDVNAPDVSWNGRKIVFAGVTLESLDADRGPGADPGAWRIFKMNLDGTGLEQLTFTDLDTSSYASIFLPDLARDFENYDDTDPVWLPDGRICFASTRYPMYGEYNQARTTQLFVMNADGSGMHRITSEKGGAERPVVDPVTGKIVFSRWMRNAHLPAASCADVPSGIGWAQKDCLTHEEDRRQPDLAANIEHNFWAAASIRPDGTELQAWTVDRRTDTDNQFAGGRFLYEGEFFGDLLGTFIPLPSLTEQAGFGGVALYHRGAAAREPLLGVNRVTQFLLRQDVPGVYAGPYAAAGCDALGKWIVPYTLNPASYDAQYPYVGQDYDLVEVDPATREITGVFFASPGTAELRPCRLGPRPRPPVLEDTVTQTASMLPPPDGGPYDGDGTFVFDALNVYFNAEVDVPILSAPQVGSAAFLRSFVKPQRSNCMGLAYCDYPELVAEVPVAADGSARIDAVPADLPLFEDLRGTNGGVPLTGGLQGRVSGGQGAAIVVTHNYGRPGTTVQCVGCHAGHSLIPVPEDLQDARWTNLAPGALPRASSSAEPKGPMFAIDRVARNGETANGWRTPAGQTTGQWISLEFPVDIAVRTVRLWNLRQGGPQNVTVQVHAATVILYADAAGTVEAARASVTADLSETGTDIAFPGVRCRLVRVEIDDVSGRFDGDRVAGLAEIEVIGQGLQIQ